MTLMTLMTAEKGNVSKTNLFSYTTIGRKSQKKQRDDFYHLFNHFHQPPKSKKEIQNSKQRKKKKHTHTHTKKKNLSNILNTVFSQQKRASLSFSVRSVFPRFSSFLRTFGIKVKEFRDDEDLSGGRQLQTAGEFLEPKRVQR